MLASRGIAQALCGWVVCVAAQTCSAQASEGDLPPVELWRQELTLPGGQDHGQRLGTVFEARSREGTLLLSAGFVNGGQSLTPANHRTLSVYVQTAEGVNGAPVRPQPLPERPFAATSLFALATYQGNLLAYEIGMPGPLVQWDTGSRKWTPLEHAQHAGRGALSTLQVVDNKLLLFFKSGISYDGVDVDISAIGGLSNSSLEYGLYFNDRLLLSVYRENSPFPGHALLYDCKWSRLESELGDCHSIEFADPHLRETRGYFAYGMHPLADGQVLIYGLSGFIFVYRDGALRPLVDISPSRSWQVYSTIERYGDLLLGQYPHGSLMRLRMRDHLSDKMRPDEWTDAERLATLIRPPVAPTSPVRRDEAQSLMLMGDDLYVGMWPWGELYRGLDGTAWKRVAESFTGQIPSDDGRHPFETDVRSNCLGMRIYQIVPWQGGLAFQTTVKNETPECAAVFRRLSPSTLEPYGRVHYVDVPGALSCPLSWAGQPQRLRISLTSDDRVTVFVDGQAVCGRNVQVGPVIASLAKPDAMTWKFPAVGVFGRRTQGVAGEAR